MTSDVHSALERIAHDVHGLLLSLDPSQFQQELVARFRERVSAIEKEAAALSERLEKTATCERTKASLGRMRLALAEARERAAAVREPSRKEMGGFRERLQPAYASFVDALGKTSIHVPNFRPTNLRRTLFHLGSGLLGLIMVQWVLVTEALYHWVPLALPLLFWGLEIGRRRWLKLNDALMAALGKMAHAHEWHKVNSGTWYGTALALLAWTVEPFAASVGLMVLGTADPSASLVGRRFGKRKIRGGKTLEGLLAFWVVASLAGWFILLTYAPPASLESTLFVAMGAGMIAALGETFLTFVDDNFTIPLLSGWSISILWGLLV